MLDWLEVLPVCVTLELEAQTLDVLWAVRYCTTGGLFLKKSCATPVSGLFCWISRSYRFLSSLCFCLFACLLWTPLTPHPQRSRILCSPHEIRSKNIDSQMTRFCLNNASLALLEIWSMASFYLVQTCFCMLNQLASFNTLLNACQCCLFVLTIIVTKQSLEFCLFQQKQLWSMYYSNYKNYNDCKGVPW